MPQRKREKKRGKTLWRDDVFSWPPRSSFFREGGERERGETQTAKRITESREERKGQKILLLKVKGRRARYEQTEGGGRGDSKENRKEAGSE